MHSAAMAEKGFSGCVGFVDGTMLPFAERPEYKGDFYFNRKSDFSLNMQVVNDQHQRILYGFIGYSGITSFSCSFECVFVLIFPPSDLIPRLMS